MHLYPDGAIDTFTNVGGTSWLNDDHIKVFSINHEHFRVDDEEKAAEKEGLYDTAIRDTIEEEIIAAIERMKDDEKEELP